VTSLRVVVVMPPATHLQPAAALEQWPTFTKALEALQAAGTIEPIGCCRSASSRGMVERNAVTYYFETSDRHLANRVAALHPDVVHVHGLGFTRLLVALRRAVGRDVPIVLQHHGEQPPTSTLGRAARRATRHMVAGYLFTGADGQAEAFRRVGIISPSARMYEVLESASHLDGDDAAREPELGGHPCVLWVGRLIASKDPLCAVHAIAVARRGGSDAELHLLATDRSLEPDVRQLVAELGLEDVVHVHPPVDHAEMPGWYRRADVYLSTSHHEGSNYSLIEALGFGCVPVVTDIPSHAAIVKALTRTFAVGDADTAGSLIATTPSISREVVVEHAQHWLSWSAIAGQLAAAYFGARRA
jgi:glycosyltransferase involved in cell wall biosynthesis